MGWISAEAMRLRVVGAICQEGERRKLGTTYAMGVAPPPVGGVLPEDPLSTSGPPCGSMTLQLRNSAMTGLSSPLSRSRL